MKVTRTLSSYVLLVGVMGLSIVGGIVAYQLYSAAVKSQATKEQVEAIKPLDGVINKATLDKLNTRTRFSDSEMGVILSAAPTPVASEAAVTTVVTAPEVPEATSSATIQETP